VNAPNFFLAGAAKSGTTSLYRALRQHDDVFLPDLKEPHVYAYLADRSTAGHLYTDAADARRRYAKLYAEVAGQTAMGDASTTNLVVPGAAAAIAADVPSARVVVILRHPVDRAFSHHSHFVAAGGEEIADFGRAVREEAPRQRAGFPFTYQYLAWGRYSGQLRPFLELFGPDRVLVHLYDDLCTDPEAVVRSTCRFLGVAADGALPPVGRYNRVEDMSPRRRGLRRVLRGAKPVRPTLDPDVRAELTATFREEILNLEALLGRDLSAWR